MRLIGLEIEECRSIGNGWLPLEGLVVLFGPNSAGKTTVLEAVRELFGSRGHLRRDPGDEGGDPYAKGYVWLTLPGANLPNSEDRRIMRDLLAGKYFASGNPWSFLDPEAKELLADAELEDIQSFVIDALVKQGSAGSREDRARLAKCCFEEGLFRVDGFYGPGRVVLCLDPETLDSQTRSSVEAIVADVPIEDDELGRVAWSLAGGNVSDVALVGDRGDQLLGGLAPVITLDSEPDRLAVDIQAILPSIHDRLWGKLKQLKQLKSADVSFGVVDEFRIESSVPSTNQFVVDPWVESLVEGDDTGRIVTPKVGDRYDVGDWHRVRRSLIATAREVSDLANRRAPSFVRDYGKIEVEILPVAVWSSSPSRVRVTIREPDSEPRDLGIIGSGIARWVAASVRLACQQLDTATRTITDDQGRLVTDFEESNRIIEAARKDPLGQKGLKLVPEATAPAVYLIDEPEAHLHPLAVRSVAGWLGELAHSAATVVVATHNPAFLEAVA